MIFFFSVKNVYISTLIINLSGRYFLITFCENASKLDPLRHHLDSLVTESDTVMAGFFSPYTGPPGCQSKVGECYNVLAA